MFRREITPVEMTQSIAALEQDITTARWEKLSYPAAAVEQKAEDLSAGHASVLGCRTLDIIHVAAALMMGAKEFLTFDHRQGALATAAGFIIKKVNPRTNTLLLFLSFFFFSLFC